MKKLLLVVAIFLGFNILNYAAADEKYATGTFNELVAELKTDGVTQEDIQGIQASIKDMLGGGTKKEDIKKVVTDLVKNEVKGKDLANSVKSMNDLIKSGEDPKEVGNIVSKAAHDAQAMGLKGKDLAAKVHEAIMQRKQMGNALKRERRKQQKTQALMEKKIEHKMPKHRGKP